MTWVWNILLGGAAVAVGYLFVRYSNWMVYNIGRVNFAEKYLRSSHAFYKMLGIILIFLGFLGMTGMLGSFVMGTIGKLFGVETVQN